MANLKLVSSVKRQVQADIEFHGSGERDTLQAHTATAAEFVLTNRETQRFSPERAQADDGRRLARSRSDRRRLFALGLPRPRERQGAVRTTNAAREKKATSE